MSVEQARTIIINGFIAATILLSMPISLVGQAWAQEQNPPINQTLEQDYADEDPSDGGVSAEYVAEYDNKQITTQLNGLEKLADYHDSIRMSPQDAQALRDGRVDVRVTDYLLYLVTPLELGGAGLDNIKIQRILKNYNTDGIGRFDRETLSSIEEGENFVSAHNSGQAIDISEVGAVTCKLIKKSYLGGSSTSFQRAKPIKIAWQSREGINRTPTPRGPSLYEVASNMSAQSILQMLNDSGEMDDFADYVKGLSVEEIFQYVGANILMKHYGTGDIMVDPRSGDIADVLGALILQRLIPNLPPGLPTAQANDDIRVAIARAHLEDLLNLPPGSLRGSGWNEILASTGKRTMENALGLPALTFDSRSLAEVLKNGSVQASLKQFKKDDSSFGVLPGTIAIIAKGDDQGFIWAGANLFADALRLSDAQKQQLIQAVKNSQTPNITLSSTGSDVAAPINVLEALLDKTGGTSVLKDFGQKYLGQILGKVVPNELLGLTKAVVGQLANSTSNVVYGDLRRSIGSRKIASDSSIPPAQADALKNGTGNNRYYSQIANTLNNEFAIDSNSQLTASDISSLFTSGGDAVLAKVGGNQADKAIGWNPGTGYAVINGDKTLAQGLQEVFTSTITQIAGLRQGTTVSLNGDLSRNYGDALVEQSLGINIAGNGSATDISPQTLYPAFGISDSRSLAQLRSDSGFWSKNNVKDALEFTDVRLGVALGTSEDYLRGKINNDKLSKTVAQENLGKITQEKVLSFLDLDDAFKLSKDELGYIITTIGSWDSAGLSAQQKVLNLGLKLIGRTWDQRTAFGKDAFLNIVQSKDQAALVDQLIDQGIRRLAGALGANIDSFEPADLKILSRLITDAYNGGINGSTGAYGLTAEALITKWLTDATKIPVTSDVKTFITGDFRAGLEYWSAAQMVEFATKFLPDGSTLTYDEMRNAIDLTDSSLINLRAQTIAAKEGGTADKYTDQARRELMQEARDNSKYKISDAFLRQAEIPVPANFSQTMFAGSTQERSEMMTNVVFSYIDRELQKINPNYVPGTLAGIFAGDIDPLQTDQIISNIVSNSSVSLGSFSTGFIANFYQFIKAGDKTSFFTDSKHSSMWQYMENWLGNNLGISGLSAGYAKTIYYASQHGWSTSASLTQNGKVIVPSINQLGQALVASRLTQMADKVMNLPVGSSYQIYQAATGVASASRALAAARAAGDAGRISQAQNGLASAQNELTVIAITIALNSCQACQQFFSSIDRLIAAPPGFTNALVAGAIAAAFGLGPAGLIAAAAIFLFGVYKVEYKCPLPPPDRFALTQFDDPLDQLEPSKNTYYSDPNKPVKDHPAPGENPFDWDDGVPFVDGNNPELWMAWSRYFTGKLLDSTMAFGASNTGAKKPVQVITFRQANAEYFAPKSLATFGPEEIGNNRVGLGFTQASTKTTDWVHTAFGGFF
ncbi:MAG: hypothetical protein WD970_02445 [Patescibacteria group bacterium]